MRGGMRAVSPPAQSIRRPAHLTYVWMNAIVYDRLVTVGRVCVDAREPCFVERSACASSKASEGDTRAMRVQPSRALCAYTGRRRHAVVL